MATRNILVAPLFEQRRILKKVDVRTFRQGEAMYFRSGVTVQECQLRVANLTVREGDNLFALKFTMDGDEPTAICECPVSRANPNEWCSHAVAGAFAMYNWLYRYPPVTWEGRVEKLLDTRGKKNSAVVRDQILAFALHMRVEWTVTAYTVATKGMDGAVMDQILSGADLAQLRPFSEIAKPVRGVFEGGRILNNDPGLIMAASMCALAERHSQYGAERETSLNNLFPLLQSAPFYREADGIVFHTPINIARDPASPQIALHETNTDLRVQPELVLGSQLIDLSDKSVSVVTQNPMWVVTGGDLMLVDSSRMDLSDAASRQEILVPAEDREEFLASFLEPIAERVPITGSSLTWETIEEPPVPRIYLAQQDKDVVARLRFGYGGYELPFQPKAPETTVRRKPGTMELVRVKRDVDQETSSQEMVAEFGLRRGKLPDEFLLRTRTNPIEFIMHSVPRMIEAGFEVFGEENIQSVKVNRSRPKISFEVGSGIDWFDVKITVDFDGVKASMKDLRHAIRHKEKFVRLGDGTYGQLPENWLDQYRQLFVFGDVTDEGVKLRKTQAALLDSIFEDSDNARFDDEFEEARERLKTFEHITPRDLPVGLNADLREYQKYGYDWLHFLRDFGFGGCLADDMGLGKTIQALTFLLSLKEQGLAKAASLVVIPRSLMVNWQREAAKFTPDLKVLANADSHRIRNTKEFEGYDIILTTYGTMLRDIAHLSKYRFNYAILDESQVIKNPSALVSRAARALNADHRLTLTGTPLENTTLDLWSQFDFLNPGLLGTLEQFKSEYASVIERTQDEGAATFLRKMVYPFILRRTKDQVAPELPPRTERVIVTDMDKEQRAIYDKYKNHYRNMLLGIIDNVGVNNARMKILEGLLRLRQISNHPKLVEPDTTAGSAKLDALMETLLTLQAEGHKVLIFSQFVQMLRIIKDEFEKVGVRYEYLTGQTKNRQEIVDNFQGDPEIPFFLISLKAGGVGLNLTAADYVMHVDPWWNPAVEMQASDRTHRIGQDKPVFVYKFVVRDSVEDKILQLQSRKKDLVTQIVASEAGFFKSLGREEISVLFE